MSLQVVRSPGIESRPICAGSSSGHCSNGLDWRTVMSSIKRFNGQGVSRAEKEAIWEMREAGVPLRRPVTGAATQAGRADPVSTAPWGRRTQARGESSLEQISAWSASRTPIARRWWPSRCSSCGWHAWSGRGVSWTTLRDWPFGEPNTSAFGASHIAWKAGRHGTSMTRAELALRSATTGEL